MGVEPGLSSEKKRKEEKRFPSIQNKFLNK
jgi:hypothetical protein